VDVLSRGGDGDPAEAVGRDIVADLETERVTVEAERGVGVVDGDEHGGNGDGHGSTIRAPTRRVLLRSCSVWALRPRPGSAVVASQPCSRRAERPRGRGGGARGTATASARRSR